MPANKKKSKILTSLTSTQRHTLPLFFPSPHDQKITKENKEVMIQRARHDAKSPTPEGNPNTIQLIQKRICNVFYILFLNSLPQMTAMSGFSVFVSPFSVITFLPLEQVE